ncbi:MAG: nucleotidyltransferase family protein [Saprospiraceae bacterium]|nr:nucleotidyltransferase family protein [Saprospiraceae bacterium]
MKKLVTMSLAEIKERLSNLKPELHERFGVVELGVFGSYVRGEQRRGSDIDILVSFDRSITLFGLYDLQEFLEKKMHRRIDIVLKNGLKEHIGKQILEEVEFII